MDELNQVSTLPSDVNATPEKARNHSRIALILGIFGIAASCTAILFDVIIQGFSILALLSGQNGLLPLYNVLTVGVAVIFTLSFIAFACSVICSSASIILSLASRKNKSKRERSALCFAIPLLVLCGIVAVILRGLVAFVGASLCYDQQYWIFMGLFPTVSAFLGLIWALVMSVLTIILMDKRRGNRLPVILSIVGLLLYPLFGLFSVWIYTITFSAAIGCMLLIALVLVLAFT